MTDLWGYHIWLEMWLGDMAGGAYFSAFLFERFTGNKQLLRPATFLAIPLVVAALVLSLIDLGEPIRFWHMLVSVKPLSPLWLGTFLSQSFVGIAVIMAILWIIESRMAEQAGRNLRRVIAALSWINVIFAGSLMAYSGVLMSSTNIPLWAGTDLLPSMLVASAVATGIAILVFSSLIYRSAWQIQGKTLSLLAGVIPLVLIIQLVLVGTFIALAGSSSTKGAGEAVKALTTGSLAIPFWITLAAFLVSIGLVAAVRGKDIEKKAVRSSLILSSVCVILGGLLIRAVIVIGGQL